MGNFFNAEKKDETWKQQNKQMQENPAYKFANLNKGGSLIDAYYQEGPLKVMEIAAKEMSDFFYNKDGRSHWVTESEFLRYQWKYSQRLAGLDDTENVSDEKLRAEYVEDYFNKFTPHEACWDLEKRGGVGETPFHLLYLMDTQDHLNVAKILLEMYPSLALDVYEGEDYFGESALHIAVVQGDFEIVQMLVEAGANVNQRATGRFFLPEDQKKVKSDHTNYEGYAYYGEYPLAFAACLGNKDIYDYLLDHGANPDFQDSFGNTVLHMVVVSDQSDMYKYAVRHHKHPANTVIKNHQNLTPLTLACKLGRQSIFKEMLDVDSIEFWRFSTTMCSAHPLRTLDSIGPDGSTSWNSALVIIVNGEKDDHLEMLEGGVMRQLLIEKWKTFAKRRFMIRLVLAIIHLALFSVSIYTRPEGSDLLEYKGPVDAIRYTSEVIVCVSCLITVYSKLKEFSKQGFANFFINSAHAPAQTVYLISCLLVLACIPFRFTAQYNIEDILLILAAPCMWIFLLFFARGYNLTGPFVTMIYKMIAGDLLRFGIIYIIFLSGFTQSFSFLFHDISKNTTDTDLAKFATLPETILNLFQMTLGEFKYDIFSLSHYSPLTKIIFAFFMILVPILLLNMLIAMMGNTYTQVISKSTKEWWKQWAKIVVVLEWGISRKKLLEFQRAYSVKLAGAPHPDDNNPPAAEERALVVIKTCSKSRAKTRKDALFRWKTLGKEVIRQLRKKKDGQPFELEESLKRGQLLEDSNQVMLSSTVAQLAWEKDINLTGGPILASDSPTNRLSTSHSLNLNSVQNLLPNGSAPTEKGSQKHDPRNLKTELDDHELILGSKNRTLVHNRVSPFAMPKIDQEGTFPSTFVNVTQKDMKSGRDNFDYVFPSISNTKKLMRRRSHSSGTLESPKTYTTLLSGPETVLSTMPILTDASSAKEINQNIVRNLPVSIEGSDEAKPCITDSSNLSHLSMIMKVTSLSPEEIQSCNINQFEKATLQGKGHNFPDTEVRDGKDHNIPDTKVRASAATCWTEYSPNPTSSRKRSKRKDKKKAKDKVGRRRRSGLHGSSSSVVTLLDSPGSSANSHSVYSDSKPWT